MCPALATARPIREREVVGKRTENVAHLRRRKALLDTDIEHTQHSGSARTGLTTASGTRRHEGGEPYPEVDEL